jgi:hypothetical protein
MVSDEIGQQLHDKATRGISLTPEERQRLEAWYARHDAEEMALLARSEIPDDLDALRTEVKAGMARLVGLAERIQRQANENDARRRELADLQSQLAQKRLARPA